MGAPRDMTSIRHARLHTSQCAELCHTHAVEMHNDFQISAVQAALGVAVRWLDVTDFSTRGGSSSWLLLVPQTCFSIFNLADTQLPKVVLL